MGARKYTRVKSSNLKDVSYDVKNRTLFIRFKKRPKEEYEFSGVPLNVFNNLLKAPSIGGYFATYIKHRYNYRKL